MTISKEKIEERILVLEEDIENVKKNMNITAQIVWKSKITDSLEHRKNDVQGHSLPNFAARSTLTQGAVSGRNSARRLLAACRATGAVGLRLPRRKQKKNNEKCKSINLCDLIF